MTVATFGRPNDSTGVPEGTVTLLKFLIPVTVALVAMLGADTACMVRLLLAVLPPVPVQVRLRVMDGLPVAVILDEGSVNEPDIEGLFHTGGEFLKRGLLAHVIAFVVDHETVVD
jgi:hypothetical protein